MPIGEPLRPGDPTRIGPYDVLSRLGEGGMGAVHLARSPGGRLLAIKTIHRRYGSDPDFHARFVRELAAARRVTGAYTAPVLDADTDGPAPWVATAFLPGLSLQDAVQRFGPLPPDPVRTLAAGLAEALTAIAAAGIAHRDVKPANIMLTRDGPRVIDFGIARFAEGTAITAAGTTLGTPGYIAPEYLATGRSGPAGDVFALGAVLAFAATGRPPFGSGPVAARLIRAERGEIDLEGVYDQPLRDLIRRCVRRDPQARPDAARILTELSAGAAGASIEGIAAGAGRGGSVAGATGTAAPVGVGWLPPPVARAVVAVPAVPVRALPRRAVLSGGGLAVLAAAGGGVLLWRRHGTGDPAAASSGAAADGPRNTVSSTPPTPPVRTPGKAVLRWRTTVAATQPDLAVAAGLIHLRVSGSTAALDPRTRTVRWRRTGLAGSAVTGDRVWTATDTLAVSALDAATGAELWRWRPKTPEEHSSGPVPAGPRILGAGRYRAYALDAATGRQQWTRAWDDPIWGIGGDATGVVVFTEERISGLDPATGTTRWERPMRCEDDLFVAAGLAHLSLQRFGGIVTLRTADGSDVWLRSNATTVRRPGADGRVLYLHDAYGRIFAIEAATGRDLWSLTMPGDDATLHMTVGDDTSLVDGCVCVARIDRMLYAVRQSDGAAAWTFESRDQLAGGVVSDGTSAYVATLDGRLLALRLPEVPRAGA